MSNTELISNRIPNKTRTSANASLLSAPIDANPSTKIKLKFYIETYGCQMNLSDSEIVRSILISAGHEPCSELSEADLVLTNTCAIRENAESKVWHRLNYFHSIRKRNRAEQRKLNGHSKSRRRGNKQYTPVVGILGCMAERLKDRLLLEDSVDFVCGPDAYRDIPLLLDGIVNAGQKQANTMLSFEETYADISPVREVDRASAFVSIMRGCNNMCSFCIVPFTRGRERSRPMASILGEVKALSDKGVKEVVLLGQNVNGYHDTSNESAELFPTSTYKATPGFNNLYRSKKRDLPGARFPDLLHAIADVNSEMRVRFTSPHPKDFPLEVLSAIASRPNICSSVHLPVQSGSSSALQRMRRGYSRESFLDLVDRVRSTIPGVSISTDIIAGFCEESEEEHEDTLSLLRAVGFDQAFMYAYSLRDRTHAAHTMEDNVPEPVKKRRLHEIIATYREELLRKNVAEETGQLRLVLVEGPSSKSTPELPMFTGRTDGNKRVVFPATALLPADALLEYALKVSGNREESGASGAKGEIDAETYSPGACNFAQLGKLLRAAPSLQQYQTEELAGLLARGLRLAGAGEAGQHPLTELATGSIGVTLVESVESLDPAHASAAGRRCTSNASTSSGAGLDRVSRVVEPAVKPPEAVEPEAVVGQYVAVRVLKADTPTMRGVALGLSGISHFQRLCDILGNH